MTKSLELNIDGKNCICVPLSDANFADIAAIYVIICINRVGNTYTVIDIGQTGELGTRINNHDRETCWKRKCPNGNIWVCIYKTPTNLYTKQQRLDLEHQWRAKYNNLCGER